MTFTNLEQELFSYSIPMIIIFYIILKKLTDSNLISFISGFSISYLIIFFGTDLHEAFAKETSIVWGAYSGLTYIFIFWLIFRKSKTVITI